MKNHQLCDTRGYIPEIQHPLLQTILIEVHSGLVCVFRFEEGLLLSFERTEALLQLLLLIGQSMLPGVEQFFFYRHSFLAVPTASSSEEDEGSCCLSSAFAKARNSLTLGNVRVNPGSGSAIC